MIKPLSTKGRSYWPLSTPPGDLHSRHARLLDYKASELQSNRPNPNRPHHLSPWPTHQYSPLSHERMLKIVWDQQDIELSRTNDLASSPLACHWRNLEEITNTLEILQSANTAPSLWDFWPIFILSSTQLTRPKPAFTDTKTTNRYSSQLVESSCRPGSRDSYHSHSHAVIWLHYNTQHDHTKAKEVTLVFICFCLTSNFHLEQML